MEEPDIVWATIARFRADVLRLYVNIALVVSGPLLAMYYYMGQTDLAVAVAAFVLFNSVMFVGLRRGSSDLAYPARLFVVVTLGLILYALYLGDEVIDNKPWLVLAPILTMSLLGSVEGLIWVIVAITGAGVIYGVAPGHYDPFAIIIQLACTGTASYVFYRFTLHSERNTETICRLSHIDSLTGCYNRRSFNDHFHKEFQRNQRSGASLAVLMIDIDHFKEYNDHYGHQQGDRVLTEIAHSLTDTVRRASDQVYRYGGEEFCVLLSGVDRTTTVRLAEQLRQRVRELGVVHEPAPAGRLTVSVGVCHSDALMLTDADAMLRAADQALYQAKAKGRDRVVDSDCRVAAA